jgi:Mn-dependent DtxR family transcriptional regulator
MSKALTAMSRRVLRALQDIPSEQPARVTNSGLADRLQVSPFTVSRALNELERAGQIEFRWQSPDPGRQQWSGRVIVLRDGTP